ncbi:MAG: GDP-mannose 4,6-dehydratase [Pseudomonadota bacterium]
MPLDKVLVIGSNSFSGASFVDYALRQDAYVVGTSRSPEPADFFLPYKWSDAQSNFEFHQLDLNKDLDQIIDLLDQHQPAYVVNFAAQSMVGQSWEHPEHWFQTNVVATVKLHDKLRQFECLKRYVHITTPEVYGSTEGFIKESTEFYPSTPYAVSRAAADMSLLSFHNAYDFPVIFTRAANVFGPGQQLYRIIPRTVLYIKLGKQLQLHGGGHSERSFIHIEDVSAATWACMTRGQSGQCYHISTNEIVSIRELVHGICAKLDVNFEDCVEVVGERLGKDAAYKLDSGKIRSELSWVDNISLDKGLDQCIAWVNKNFDQMKDQPLDYIHKP